MQFRDMPNGHLLHTLKERMDDDIESVVFSPDGQLLASGSQDSTVRLWNMSDISEGTLQTLTGHTSWVYNV